MEKNVFAAFGRTPSTYVRINGRQKFYFESFEEKKRLGRIWKSLSFNHRWCCNHSIKSVTKMWNGLNLLRIWSGVKLARETSSSYPSVFWLVGSFPSGIVASHSFHCCVTVSSCVSGDLLFKYCSRGLPTAFFPDIAPSRMFTTNSLCLILCPIHEWRLFFKNFKSNLSSFALWKTSSFVILSVHFIFNIFLQHHVSNAFTTLSSFFPRVQVSDP